MIDYHVHLGKSSQGHIYTSEDLIAAMDAFHIEKCGLSMLNGIDTTVLNNQVYACMKKYPHRIMGYAYINPRDPNAVNEVNRCLGKLHMQGVKFHSWKHGYFPDNNQNLDAVVDAIESYDVPILTHTGTAPLSLPQQWAMVAKRHPKVKFVFAHIGYLDYGYGCIECTKDLENVYVDTAGQVEVPVLEKALHDLGEDRIIFGSDWPYKYIGSEIEKFKVLNLTKEQKQKIFHDNAKKILKLV